MGQTILMLFCFEPTLPTQSRSLLSTCWILVLNSTSDTEHKMVPFAPQYGLKYSKLQKQNKNGDYKYNRKCSHVALILTKCQWPITVWLPRGPRNTFTLTSRFSSKKKKKSGWMIPPEDYSDLRIHQANRTSTPREMSKVNKIAENIQFWIWCIT